VFIEQSVTTNYAPARLRMLASDVAAGRAAFSLPLRKRSPATARARPADAPRVLLTPHRTSARCGPRSASPSSAKEHTMRVLLICLLAISSLSAGHQSTPAALASVEQFVTEQFAAGVL
jgi:hypothetical protein